MKASAIVLIGAFGISMISLSKAAELAVGSTARAGFGPSRADGPYYIMPRGPGFDIECGRPTVAYIEDGYAPDPRSYYKDALGYRCIRGVHAYDPIFTPRCHFGYVRGKHGWSRYRRCS